MAVLQRAMREKHIEHMEAALAARDCKLLEIYLR